MLHPFSCLSEHLVMQAAVSLDKRKYGIDTNLALVRGYLHFETTCVTGELNREDPICNQPADFHSDARHVDARFTACPRSPGHCRKDPGKYLKTRDTMHFSLIGSEAVVGRQGCNVSRVLLKSSLYVILMRGFSEPLLLAKSPSTGVLFGSGPIESHH